MKMRSGAHPAPKTQPMETTVNIQQGSEAFEQAGKFFNNAQIPEGVQAMAQQGVAASNEFYAKASAAAEDGAKTFTDIADTAWASAKMLNEKIVKNFSVNAETALHAAQAMAAAKSMPEIAKIQGEFVQKFAAGATEQTKEFADLVTRVTHHIFEKAQATAGTTFKTKY